jgi:hypothetical protein
LAFLYHLLLLFVLLDHSLFHRSVYQFSISWLEHRLNDMLLVFIRNWFSMKKKPFISLLSFDYMCDYYSTLFYFVIFFVLPCNYPFDYILRLWSLCMCQSYFL